MNKLEVMERVLEDIKSMDILDIVKRYLDVKRVGSSYTALCPFHNDSSIGNFMIDSRKNIFKCFACGEGGDAVSFVSKYLGLNFTETIALLGQDYGLLTVDEYEKYFSDSKKVGKREKKFIPKKREETSKLVSKRSDAELDFVYRIFLEHLTLKKDHYDHLLNDRCFSERSIEKGYYRSLDYDINMKEIVESIISNLISSGFDETMLIGVPGFYKERNKWQFSCIPGLLIPIKNHLDQIIGIQIRRDNDSGTRYIWFSSTFAIDLEKKQMYGCGPEQPMDVIYPENNKYRKQIFITEGRFKSEIIANKWGFITISVQGVTNWKGISKLIMQIEEKVGFKFSTVFTAFDADMSFNYQVFEQLMKMTDSIEDHFDDEKNIVYLHWDYKNGKGIDDLILNTENIKENGLIKKYKKEVVDNRYKEEVNKVIELKTNMKEKEIKSIAIVETFAV